MRFWSLILLCLASFACSHKVLHAGPAGESVPPVSDTVIPVSDTVILSEAKDLFSLLDAKLDEYVTSMSFISPEEKMQECDFLIGSVSDSLIRNHVALYLYQKFADSNIMGDEAVTIYLTDNWFVPGKVAFPDYASLATARVFADFNRQSLLGMQAPSLMAYTPEGDLLDVLPSNGRLKVLFIYDTSCATCKVESAILNEYFSTYSGHGFDFIAFYSGADADAWQQWRETHFTALTSRSDDKISIRNYWDPEVESDFQRKFGVLSTPKVFLIDENGVIVGRRLDPQALAELLKIYDLE